MYTRFGDNQAIFREVFVIGCDSRETPLARSEQKFTKTSNFPTLFATTVILRGATTRMCKNILGSVGQIAAKTYLKMTNLHLKS